MSKANFIISTDSCVDLFKGYLNKRGVHCITMKYVINGVEIGEHYNTEKEFATFYQKIKGGALPTTVALNPIELQQHFEDIFESEEHGDIIHIPLSSGLSVTCDSAKKAAAVVNSKVKDRKIHVVDSLIATLGMGWLVDELISLRDKGATTKEAIERVTQLRDNMHAWVIVSDLLHLKRGGRISGAKATIGTILGIKPVIIVNKNGKLVIESKAKGDKKAIGYVMGKMQEFGENVRKDFGTSTIWVARTSESKMLGDLKTTITKKYPNATIKDGIIGPVIGSHLGCGAVIVFFEGAPRLDIN